MLVIYHIEMNNDKIADIKITEIIDLCCIEMGAIIENDSFGIRRTIKNDQIYDIGLIIKIESLHNTDVCECIDINYCPYCGKEINLLEK